MNKEDNYVKNRLLDLADITYSKNIYAYSDFLNLNEINIFNTITNQLPPVNYYLTGGNVYAERKIVVFKPIEVYYEEDVPITLLKIEPLNKKYADTLNHRDYLGAILNLGIDRSKIGDIFIGENVAYIYVITGISDYIINNFTKVKHTLISCKIAYDEIENVRPNLKEIKGTIGNIRLDSIISLAFNKSRSSIVSYIEEKKVFVNGKIITSNGYSIKENDIIAVPGADVRETVAYKIAVQAVPELADKELLPIYMPMTHDKAELELNHEKGAKALEAALDTGKNVVFLTLGDPTIYSTFTYVQKRVEADGYQTKLVSGITSFCATAARLNIPLTEWNQPLHVQPAVHRLDSELDQPGTYVLMKSGKKMNQVKEILAKSGRNIRMVENCGMPDEHIYNSVEEIPDDAGYYSLIIAKEQDGGL